MDVYCTYIYLSLDIDECTEGTSRCNQNCSNTEGNYTCDCFSGYQLSSDTYTCLGEQHVYTQDTLYTGHSVHRSLCTQVILYKGHSVHRSLCTQVTLYT